MDVDVDPIARFVQDPIEHSRRLGLFSHTCTSTRSLVILLQGFLGHLRYPTLAVSKLATYSLGSTIPLILQSPKTKSRAGQR